MDTNITCRRSINDSSASICNNSICCKFCLSDNIHRIHVDASSIDKQQNLDKDDNEMVLSLICICFDSNNVDIRCNSTLDIRYKSKWFYQTFKNNDKFKLGRTNIFNNVLCSYNIWIIYSNSMFNLSSLVIFRKNIIEL